MSENSTRCDEPRLSIIELQDRYITKNKNLHLVTELEVFIEMHQEYKNICKLNPDLGKEQVLVSLKKFKKLLSSYIRIYTNLGL